MGREGWEEGCLYEITIKKRREKDKYMEKKARNKLDKELVVQI